MRTTGDRIRHAICFEIFGLIIVTPLGAWAFDRTMQDVGLVAFVSAGIGALWNYAYNLLFDHMMLRVTGSVVKTIRVRGRGRPCTGFTDPRGSRIALVSGFRWSRRCLSS